MSRTKYKTIKFFVSIVIALLGAVLAFREGVNISLPCELEEVSNWMLLGVWAGFYALVFWLTTRAIFWVPEIWMPIQGEYVSGFHVGVTRLSRLLAIVVPIGVFFFNVTHGNFPPTLGSWSNALMAYPLIGGVTWLTTQAIGWVAEGFRENNT